MCKAVDRGMVMGDIKLLKRVVARVENGKWVSSSSPVIALNYTTWVIVRMKDKNRSQFSELRPVLRKV